MGVYHHEEAPNHPKRCKYLAATLKEVFSRCQSFSGRFSTARLKEEYPMSDFDEEQEVFISAVISQAMDNKKYYKPSVLRSFSWVYSPVTKELYVTEAMTPQEKVEEEEDEREEFLSVKSCFSCCSSTLSGETFHSVKTSFSRCSSLKESKYWRRSVIQEFCHCEGWPFGLCRKALLLPPLPKSPSESWLSRNILQRSSTKKP